MILAALFAWALVAAECDGQPLMTPINHYEIRVGMRYVDHLELIDGESVPIWNNFTWSPIYIVPAADCGATSCLVRIAEAWDPPTAASTSLVVYDIKAVDNIGVEDCGEQP